MSLGSEVSWTINKRDHHGLPYAVYFPECSYQGEIRKYDPGFHKVYMGKNKADFLNKETRMIISLMLVNFRENLCPF